MGVRQVHPIVVVKKEMERVLSREKAINQALKQEIGLIKQTIDIKEENAEKR